MPMTLITKDTDYAIRALCFLAKNQAEPASVAEISKALNISYTFLRKIMQALNKKGILSSTKGKGGGFALKRVTDEIFVNDVIDIFQGPIDFKRCIVKHQICPDFKNCLLRDKIEKIEGYAQKVLESVTIKSLIRQE